MKNRGIKNVQALLLLIVLAISFLLPLRTSAHKQDVFGGD